MNNMAPVIVPKSDQINADDLISGPLTITIREVRISAGQDQPVSIYFDGSDKAYRPCKSMSRALVYIWGPDAGQYVGRSLSLYRDPKVRFGKDQVGGIRISHMTDIPADKMDDGRVVLMLTATRAQRKPHVIQPLAAPVRKADKAAQGAMELIERISSASSDEISYIVNDPTVMKQRAWLTGNRPELASKVEAAVNEALDNPFADPNDSTLSEDNPAAAEGPADEQRGEPEQEGDAPAWADMVTVTKSDIATAATQSHLKSIMAEFDKHRAVLPDDVCAEVDALATAKRKTLAGRA